MKLLAIDLDFTVEVSQSWDWQVEEICKEKSGGGCSIHEYKV